MHYKKQKERLVESLLVREADSSLSDLLPADKIVLNKEEELEDTASELIAEVLKK